MNSIEREIQRIAEAFHRRYPEFHFGDGNMRVLQDWMNKNSMPVTLENLSIAYEALKNEGKTFTDPKAVATPTTLVGTTDAEGFVITGVVEIDAIRTPSDIRAIPTPRFIWLRKKYGDTFNRRIGEVDSLKNNSVHSAWGNQRRG
jgi:hypothetical protein